MSEITNEMKAKCMGEFKLSYEDICPKCILGDDSPCMCNSDQNGVFTNTRAVPWDLCKQIFKTMYALSPAAAENAALKEENERLKARVAELQKSNFHIGLIAAAVVIENKIAEYDYEHGRTEPDTNCRVYPGNGEDYVYSMIELAEELRMIADKEPANEG